MRRHRLVSFISAVVLAGGFAILGTSGSASAATCFGASCAGHDPALYNCSATHTVSAVAQVNGVTLATVENRFSSGCDSNWGRAQLSAAGLQAGDSLVVDVFALDRNGVNEYMCYPGPSNTGRTQESCTCTNLSFCPSGTYHGSSWAYTDMVDGKNVATARVFVYNSSGQWITQAEASQ